MTALTSATSGVLVAIETRPYDFVGRDGNRVVGHTNKLYIVPEFEGAVLEVKCDDALYQRARNLGQGANVEALIEITARDNKVVYTARGLELVSSNGKAKVGA